jgi:dolichyl-phosphate-mannose-protein mannosyltransferase
MRITKREFRYIRHIDMQDIKPKDQIYLILEFSSFYISGGFFMAKNILIFFVISLVILMITCPIFGEAVNIIKNPGFEQFKNDLPSEWSVKDGVLPPNAKVEGSIIYPHSGKSCLTIENSQPTDTMVIQNLNVQPDKVYKISCWIKADIKNQPGSANITLYYVNNGYGCKGIYSSKEFQNTGAQWVKLEFNIHTLRESLPLTLGIRLGGQGTGNQGKASFDDLVVELVKNPSVVDYDFNSSSSGNTSNTSSSNNNVLLFVVLGIFGLGLMVYFEFKFSQKNNEQLIEEEESELDGVTEQAETDEEIKKK